MAKTLKELDKEFYSKIEKLEKLYELKTEIMKALANPNLVDADGKYAIMAVKIDEELELTDDIIKTLLTDIRELRKSQSRR